MACFLCRSLEYRIHCLQIAHREVLDAALAGMTDTVREYRNLRLEQMKTRIEIIAAREELAQHRRSCQTSYPPD